MDLSDRSNLFKTADGEGDFRGNEELCYFPLVSKEQYEKKEAEGFVESKFGGSLKNFLVAFRGSDKIGKNDMKDLRAWLDELDD